MDDYKSRIIRDLDNLGVSPGDALLVHSSLRSVGSFENRAEILTGAMAALLGKSGTLLMPALSYENVTPVQPVFDIRKTFSCVGGLTEYFRSFPGVRRSLHPTHSVCALGSNASFFLEGHELDHTPCGPESPFRRLKEAGGLILFLGCGLLPNTSMHGIEELTVPPYLFGAPLRYTLVREDGSRYEKEYIQHNFRGFEQRYDRVAEILAPADFTFGHILGAPSWLLKSAALWEKAGRKMEDDPLFFVDKNPLATH